jgi:hypothetical protein
MPRRPLTKKWTDEDIAKLIQLADAGATLARAAAALNRNSSSVQKKARALGKHLPGVRQVRADLRAVGAIDADKAR